MSAENEQMLAEIQAIPDGTIVAVYARYAMFSHRNDSFHLVGPMWTHNDGQRSVGDTNLTWNDDGEWRLSNRVEFVKPIGEDPAWRAERMQSAGVQLASIRQAASDAGMGVRKDL